MGRSVSCGKARGDPLFRILYACYSEVLFYVKFQRYEESASRARMSTSSHVDTANEGMWRSGRLLVCRRDAHFPDRCVKSNDPVGPQRTRLKLRWFHPIMLLAGASTASKTRDRKP